MARPLSDGLSYFPFDVDFFSDFKIRSLRANYGADGIALYIYSLCQIYRNGYYVKADDDFVDCAAADLGLTIDKTRQIMKYFCKRSLFDGTLLTAVDVLTAKSVQRRYQEARKGSKRDIFVDEQLWLLESDETLEFIKVRPASGSSENNLHSSENNPRFSEKNSTKEKKRKEKEIIVKERKEEVNSADALPSPSSSPSSSIDSFSFAAGAADYADANLISARDDINAASAYNADAIAINANINTQQACASVYAGANNADVNAADAYSTTANNASTAPQPASAPNNNANCAGANYTSAAITPTAPPAKRSSQDELREALVRKYGEYKVTDYEIRYVRWQTAKGITGDISYNAIARWIMQDNAEREQAPTYKPDPISSFNRDSSFDINEVEQQILDRYRKLPKSNSTDEELIAQINADNSGNSANNCAGNSVVDDDDDYDTMSIINNIRAKYANNNDNNVNTRPPTPQPGARMELKGDVLYLYD